MIDIVNSDRNTSFLVYISKVFWREILVSFGVPRKDHLFIQICAWERKMRGLWQGCFGMVAGEYSEQYQPQDWAWEKSFANPLPALLLFSTTLPSPCSTTLLPLFCMLADLMCHYIKYFSEVQIGWIYHFLFSKKSVSVKGMLYQKLTSHFWLCPWHFSGGLSDKANSDPAVPFLFCLSWLLVVELHQAREEYFSHIFLLLCVFCAA